MTQPAGHPLLVIERILRDRDSVWRQVIEERDLNRLTLDMLASSALSLGIYGAVLGASSGPIQALTSIVKLPLLFVATLAICLPTLYLFNLLFGARLSMMQAVALIMVSVTVTAVLTLAFAPISLFFLISAKSYSFFKILNVAILMLAAVVGLRFLTAGMARLNEHQDLLAREAEGADAAASADRELALAAVASGNGGPAAVAPVLPLAAAAPAGETRPAPLGRPHPVQRRPTSMTLLYIWIALFGFVGTQLAWTLRPFFGSPGEQFSLFRNIDGTFYGDLFSTIGRLFAG